MSNQIPITKQSFLKSEFNQVVDTEFRQLINNQPSETQAVLTIDDFFKHYEDLFYEIPKEGEINSHQYILRKTIEHLGVKLADDIDVQALLDEITSLRQELLDANTTIRELNK
ncbi:MAG TPA: hypothetical protein VFV86_08435 [Nitrososphaeraceae archaeon]|nr:hypothetical protein [Nitrososphaeraceae archaeon]